MLRSQVYDLITRDSLEYRALSVCDRSELLNELHWLDIKLGHQDKSLSNYHQGDMPYWQPRLTTHDKPY